MSMDLLQRRLTVTRKQLVATCSGAGMGQALAFREPTGRLPRGSPLLCLLRFYATAVWDGQPAWDCTCVAGNAGCTNTHTAGISGG